MKQQKRNNFEKNLALFQLKNPRAAFLFVMQQGEGAAEPVEESTLQLRAPAPLTLIYGPGSSYASYKAWLAEKKEHSLIIVDDNLSRIQHFLETDLASELLLNPQVHFYFYEGAEVAGQDEQGNDIVHGKEVLQEISWGTFPEPFAILEAEGGDSEKFAAFKKALLFEKDDIHATLDEYVQWGAAYSKNFWPNLQFLPESYRGTKLFSQFKGVPAIILAAGPSLTKQLPLLKELSDKALIFAGGSAMNSCTHSNLQPHFGGIIDPNPTQLKRLQECTNTDSPYFFRGRACHDALKLVKGKKLYLTGGDGYFISEWFEKKLKIKGKVLGGGHNISNFMIEIASQMGCNPIILVGFDLSYTNGAAYADNVTKSIEPTKEALVDWVDIHGKPIKTHWKWLHEALWITDFQKKKRRLRIINCTEGGIELKDIRHKSLQRACEKFVSQGDLYARVEEEIQKVGRLQCTQEQVARLKKTIKKSLEKVSENLQKLIQLIEKGESPETSTDLLLLFQEIRKEDAWGYVLEVFDRMRIKLEYYKRRFALHPSMGEEDVQAFDQMQALSHYTFLLQVVHVNLKLME